MPGSAETTRYCGAGSYPRGLRLRKIVASIDGDDRQEKLLWHTFKVLLFIPLVGFGLFQPAASTCNPALVYLALALEYLVGTCTPGS